MPAELNSASPTVSDMGPASMDLILQAASDLRCTSTCVSSETYPLPVRSTHALFAFMLPRLRSFLSHFPAATKAGFFRFWPSRSRPFPAMPASHAILILSQILILSMNCFGQTISGYAQGGSVTSYAYTAAGLQSALTAAATYQDSDPRDPNDPLNTCKPYFVVGTAGTIDLNGTPIIMPAKLCAQFVYMRTASVSSLPPSGTRLDPTTQSAYLWRIQSTFVGSTNAGLIGFVAGTGSTGTLSRYWSFEGIDWYGNQNNGRTGDQAYYSLVLLGETGATYPTSVDDALRPNHLEIRHCWFHGVAGTRNIGNALAIGADNVRVLDNYIDVIAVDSSAGNISEAHAIQIGYTNGPIEIRNNYLNASTENTFIGGTFMPAGMLPSFISFVGNTYAKQGYYKFGSGTGVPTSDCFLGNVWRRTDGTPKDYWCDGSNTWQDQGALTTRGPTTVKNVWEAKMGRGVTVFGQDMSGIWAPSGQTGEMFVINLVTQATSTNPAWVQPNTIGSQPWTTAENFDIAYNYVHDAVSGITMGYELSVIEGPCAQPSPPLNCFARAHNNISYRHILHTNMMSSQGYDFSGSPEGNGWLASINTGDYAIYIEHISYLLSTFNAASGQFHDIGRGGAAGTTSDIAVANSIIPTGLYGWNARTSGICGAFDSLAAGAPWSFSGNLLTTDLAAWFNHSYPIVPGSYSPPCSTEFAWPTGTLSPANSAAAVDGSFKVKAPYRNTATDGTDSGANIDVVNWATAGAVSGAANPYLDFRVRSFIPTAGGAVVYFTALGTADCTFTVSLSLTFSSPVGSTVFVRNGRDGKGTITGLSNDTGYWLKVTCPSGVYAPPTQIITGH